MKKRLFVCLLCILFLCSCADTPFEESIRQPLSSDTNGTERSYNHLIFFADALEFPSASGFRVLRTEADIENHHESLCFPVHTTTHLTALISDTLRARLDTLIPEDADLVKLDFDYFSEDSRYDFSFVLDIYKQGKHADSSYFALYVDVENKRFLSFGELLDSPNYMPYLQAYIQDYLQTEYKIEEKAAKQYANTLQEPNDFRLIDDGAGGMEVYLDATSLGLEKRTLIEVPESRLYSFGTADATYDPVVGKERAVALTFDGGLSDTTLKLLDILQNADAHGTFFLLGKSLENADSTIATRTLNTILSTGSEIGNLSYTGENFLHLSSEEVVQSIYKTQEWVYNLCGLYPRVVRPPTGGIQDNLIKKLPFFVIHWSVNLQHDKTLGLTATDGMTPQEIADQFMKRIQSGSIVVIHENLPDEVEAVPFLVEKLREKGYRLVTVSELLSLAESEPGQKIYKKR